MSTSERLGAPLPRLALRKEEAAAACGVSDESFDLYIRPHVPVIRCGRIRLYPVAGLERYLEENAVVDAPRSGPATGLADPQRGGKWLENPHRAAGRRPAESGRAH